MVTISHALALMTSTWNRSFATQAEKEEHTLSSGQCCKLYPNIWRTAYMLSFEKHWLYPSPHFHQCFYFFAFIGTEVPLPDETLTSRIHVKVLKNTSTFPILILGGDVVNLGKISLKNTILCGIAFGLVWVSPHIQCQGGLGLESPPDGEYTPALM